MRRVTRSSLPASNGLPLLVDPTAVNPWDFLDFNPDTYNFVARFDLATNAPSLHGAKTVELLQLDRREALEAGYRKTHNRILTAVERALQQDTIDPDRPTERSGRSWLAGLVPLRYRSEPEPIL